MLLTVLISSLAVLYPALSSAILEDPSDTVFLSEDLLAFIDFDVASSLPLDSSNQPFDFSNSEVPSLEDDLFTDSSANTPLEDETFLFSADPILESSCMTSDSGFSRYVKRGDICDQRTDESSLSRLRFPSWNEFIQQVDEPTKEPRFKQSDLVNDLIRPIPGISSNDDLCPKPRRRLCCRGPPSELVPGYTNFYTVVNFCSGKIRLDKKSLSCNASLVAMILISRVCGCRRFWTIAMHCKVRRLLSRISGKSKVDLFPP